MRSLGLRIRQFIPVFVAARNLQAGRILSRSDLELKELEAAEAVWDTLGPEDRPESFRTIAPITAGECLELRRLERYYLVRAGQTVTLVFVRPGLRVTVPGRAYSSGAAGDTIEVRTRSGARRFSGTVALSGEVVVEEL
jgi:flagella basal body P-ring formation protein FlgA